MVVGALHSFKMIYVSGETKFLLDFIILICQVSKEYL